MPWDDNIPPDDGERGSKRPARKPRTFAHAPGVREEQRAFISLTGASGGGKTKTALELAQGLCSITGPLTGRTKTFVVDSENGRAKKYAPPKGVAASPIDAPAAGKTYDFVHVPFEPPFDPDSYLDALHHCEQAGAGAVIFDSMSDEHAGEGGRLDSHDRIAGNDQKKNFAAWRPNSDARNRLLWGGFFRSPCHIILCFRAKDKSEQRGSKIVDSGFTPIGGADFIFEADCSLLFMPQASGVPTWRSELRGEQSAIKLPDEYRAIFDTRSDSPISYRHGQAMARWLNAGGEAAKRPPADKPKPASESEGADEPFSLEFRGMTYRADTPVLLQADTPIAMMEDAEIEQWSKALAVLIKAAPAEEKPRWVSMNETKIESLKPAWAKKLRSLAQ